MDNIIEVYVTSYFQLTSKGWQVVAVYKLITI